MPKPLLALCAILLALLSGCASQDPLAIRKKAYARLASFLEPGMTRRQLYALLPPQRRATVAMPFPSGIISLPALPTMEPFFSSTHETYPLDGLFQVSVLFLPAHPPHVKSPPPSSPRARPGKRKIHTPMRKNGLAIPMDALDSLLFGPVLHGKKFPSKEDPDDVIFACPEIQGLPAKPAAPSSF